MAKKGVVRKKSTSRASPKKKTTVKKKVVKKAGQGLGPLPELSFDDISNSATVQKIEEPPTPPPFEEDVMQLTEPQRIDTSNDSLFSDKISDTSSKSPGPLLGLADVDEHVEQLADKAAEAPVDEPKKKKGFSLFGKKKSDGEQPLSKKERKALKKQEKLREREEKKAKKKEAAELKKQGKGKKKEEDKPVVEDKTEEMVMDTAPQSMGGPETQDETRRYAHYLDNFKRRLDMESRERHSQARAIEGELDERAKEIDAQEKKLLKNEFNAMQYDEQLHTIKKLEHELEDRKITIEYQKQQLDLLKKQMESKDDEISSLKLSLGKYSDQLSDKEKEQYSKALKLEDDAIEYLSDQIDQQQEAHDTELKALAKDKKDLEKEIEQMHKVKVEMESKAHEILEDIEKCIDSAHKFLDQKKVKQAVQKYQEIRTLYTMYKDHTGHDDLVIYHRLTELYQAIVETKEK